MKLMPILLLLLLPLQAFAYEPPISTAGGNGFFYYSIGGGRPVPEAATARLTNRVNGSIRAGLGYTCGSFNPYTNVSQMMNEIEDAMHRLPSQFIAGATAYVINLPGYLLNKANPKLYNTIMKGFDDSFELFNSSYKSCETIQREVAQGKNPYERWIQLAKNRKWKDEVDANGNNQTIDKIEEEVNQTVANDGVTTAGGTREGGQNQPPIRVNRAVTLAGYNLLLARASDSLAPAPPPAGGSDPDPIAVAWPTPQVAISWLTDIVGEKEMVISEQGQTTAQAGRGLKPKVDALTEEVRDAINEAVLNNNFNDIETYNGALQIGKPVIQAIQAESPFVQAIQVERLANEIALNTIQDQVGMMKQILRSGMFDPDLAQSESADAVIDQIRYKTLPDLEASVMEMHNELDLRLKTMSRTALSIVNRGNDANRISDDLSSDEYDNPVLDGAVRQ